MKEAILNILNHAIMITAFVLIMMVVIEYVNVQSKSVWAQKLHQSPVLQIIIAAMLGLTPGCMGAFTVVSLYTHRLMGLAGLIAAMIATSGDEAFVMFALFPGKAMLLNGVLLVTAIAAGLIIHLLIKKDRRGEPHGFIVHEHEKCICFSGKSIGSQLRKLSFERAVLLLSAILFIIMLLTGIIITAEWDWKKVTFLSGSLFMLFIFVTVPEHFLKEHLYRHILKKHLLRLFLWTCGAFAAIHFIQSGIILEDILANNTVMILLLAVLVGMIPESGPHLLFVTLYSQHLIPFSILLASSIVQDGHGMLPLLAESRKDFLKVKAINVIAGFVTGLILLHLGM
jgi:hypothetical protein